MIAAQIEAFSTPSASPNTDEPELVRPRALVGALAFLLCLFFAGAIQSAEQAEVFSLACRGTVIRTSAAGETVEHKDTEEFTIDLRSRRYFSFTTEEWEAIFSISADEIVLKRVTDDPGLYWFISINRYSGAWYDESKSKRAGNKYHSTTMGECDVVALKQPPKRKF